MKKSRLGLFAGAFLALAASCSRPSGPADDTGYVEAARRQLADRNQPWWNGHALKWTGEPPKLKSADTGDWAAMNYNPPGFPILTLPVARALQDKSTVVKGTPFADRAVVFIDIRPGSDFYVEHIPGSRNVPVRTLDKFPEDIDRKSVVVVVGDQYPHHEVMTRVTSAGFSAAYCLEGGLRSWKASSYPLTGRSDVLEYRKLLEAEREPGASGASADFMGLGPLALKSLIDAGADLKILFVGDEATYAAGHIQGATRAELGSLDAAFKDVPKDRLIAVYCGCCAGRAGGYSEAAARRLRQMGYTRVLHLDGHLGAWREAGYPVVTASAK
jgi:rhodanese-related sulfurtransferase